MKEVLTKKLKDMINNEFEYNQSCMASAEYQAQIEWYNYLDGLIESKEYKLHAIEVVLEILKTKNFIQSGLSEIDYLRKEKEILINTKCNPKN